MQIKISVVLPVFNAERWLKEAIDSVLNQTFREFELLIYDDGSTDTSPQILKEYKDSRIKIHTLNQNKGLIYCLNQGLKDAEGEYIARMDADDVCHPMRFEKQLEYLEQNKEVGICGTQISILNSDFKHRRPCSDDELRWRIFKGSPFAHPTVLIRTEVLRSNNLNYNRDAYVAEDFDLWWKLAFHCKLANLNEELLNYRIHEAQESSAKSQVQINNHLSSLKVFIDTLELDSNRYSAKWISDMLSGEIPSTPENYCIVNDFFNAMKNSATAISFFGKASILEQESERKVFYLKNLRSFSLLLFPYCFDASFHRLLRKCGISPFIFFLKTLINWKTR